MLTNASELHHLLAKSHCYIWWRNTLSCFTSWCRQSLVRETTKRRRWRWRRHLILRAESFPLLLTFQGRGHNLWCRQNCALSDGNQLIRCHSQRFGLYRRQRQQKQKSSSKKRIVFSTGQTFNSKDESLTLLF